MQGQIDMGEHRIRNINPNPQNEDKLVPKQWIEENFLNRYNPASTIVMALGPLHTEINSISVSTKSKGTSSAESTYQTDMR